MDARSIAATAANGGMLTSAETMDCWGDVPDYHFDDTVYKNRVFFGYDRAQEKEELVCGPNIKAWPEMSPLTDNILLKVCSKIMDEVTTTDELIPSGETSSYRSNPLGLAEFTLSRRDPQYVGRAKEVNELEKLRNAGVNPSEKAGELEKVFEGIRKVPGSENVNRKHDLCGKAGGRFSQGAGRQLPEGTRRACQYRQRIRNETLPLQCNELGDDTVSDG